MVKLKTKENATFIFPIIFLVISGLISTQIKTLEFANFSSGVFFGMAMASILVFIFFKLIKKKN
jgi:phosphatidylserine synthase